MSKRTAADVIFGPVLARPEIAALNAGMIGMWLKLAQFQVAQDGLPESPALCWQIATSGTPAEGDEVPEEIVGWLGDYFPVEEDGNRRSKVVRVATEKWLATLAKSKTHGRLGGLAKARRVGDGGVGGGFSSLELQLQDPTSKELEVPPPEKRSTLGSLGTEESPSLPSLPTTTPSTYVQVAAEAWREKRGLPNFGRIGAALKPVVAAVGEADAIAGWRAYVANGKAQFGPEYFAEHFREYVPKHMNASPDSVQDFADAERRDRERRVKWITVQDAIAGQGLPRTWWDAIAISAAEHRVDPVDVAYADLQARGLA